MVTPMLVRVRGESMLPTLASGDLLWCWRWPARLPVRWLVQRMVVVRTDEGTMIKRIGRVRPGAVWLLGDNRERSTDSRDIGWVPRERIIGRVAYRYDPPERRGWLLGA